MGKEVIGIFVMLNNYFHDLAVAVFFCSVLISWFIGRELEGEGFAFGVRLLQRLWLVAKLSLVWILLGGMVRALAYRDYEWMSAAGNGQIPALIIKHLLLASLVVIGLYLQFRLRRRLSSGGEGQ